MMKKNLNTTHTDTHKHIWFVFLEMNKWGTREKKIEEPGKHTHTHVLHISRN